MRSITLVSLVTLLGVGVLGPNAEASPVQMIYEFQGNKIGYPHLANPKAGLVQDAAGNLYGTVYGLATGCTGSLGQGAVFELSPPTGSSSTWTESTIFQFPGNDHATCIQIAAGLTPDGKGNLLGIATGDVKSLFELSPPAKSGGSWTETTLYSGFFVNQMWTPLIGANGVVYFGDEGEVTAVSPPKTANAGWTPEVIFFIPFGNTASSPLISDTKENLYGSFSGSGATGSPEGTIYELTPQAKAGGAWSETAIHTFTGGTTDGEYPIGDLVFGADGAIYGTTTFGGAKNYGTIYKLAPPTTAGAAWTETILFSFNGSAASYPDAGLTATGVFYGTTSQGGTGISGTLFSFVPGANGAAPKLITLANFNKNKAKMNEPVYPATPVIKGKSGVLYGTTTGGGTPLCGGGDFCGTVYQVAP